MFRMDGIGCTTLFVISLGFLFGATTSQNPNHCDLGNHSTTGGLKWDWPPASESLVCGGRYNELHCCAHNYTDISWYERPSEKQGWIEFRVRSDRFIDTANTRNQTVIFKEVDVAKDAHDYKCVITNSHTGQKLQQIVLLTVLQCPNWLKAPLIIVPPKSSTNTTTVHYVDGDTVSLPCTAFFGDWNATGQPKGFVSWQRLHEDHTIDVIEHNKSLPVFIEDTTSISGNGLRSVLHIKKITGDDFGDYRCSAFNGRYPYPTRTYRIIEKPPAWLKTFWTCVIAVSTTTFVFLLVAGLLKYNSLRLRLCCRKVRRKVRGNSDKEKTVNLVPATSSERDEASRRPYFEKYFENSKKVLSVTTRGSQDANQWVESYRLTFSDDREKWFYFNNANKFLHMQFAESELLDNSRDILTFSGNTDSTTNSTQFLPNPVVARYVRLYPRTWCGEALLSWEVSGCQAMWDAVLVFPDEADRDDLDRRLGAYVQKKLLGMAPAYNIFYPEIVPTGKHANNVLASHVVNSRKVIIVLSSGTLKSMYRIPGENQEEVPPKNTPRHRRRGVNLNGSASSHRPLLSSRNSNPRESRLSSGSTAAYARNVRNSNSPNADSMEGACGDDVRVTIKPDLDENQRSEATTSDESQRSEASTCDENQPSEASTCDENQRSEACIPGENQPFLSDTGACVFPAWQTIDEAEPEQDVFDETCPAYCQYYQNYVNFINILQDDNLAKVIVVQRGAITKKDWEELATYAKDRYDVDRSFIQATETTLKKRINKTITWTYSGELPEGGPEDESCRSVQQFWREMELVLPDPSQRRVYDTRQYAAPSEGINENATAVDEATSGEEDDEPVALRRDRGADISAPADVRVDVCVDEPPTGSYGSSGIFAMSPGSAATDTSDEQGTSSVSSSSAPSEESCNLESPVGRAIASDGRKEKPSDIEHPFVSSGESGFVSHGENNVQVLC